MSYSLKHRDIYKEAESWEEAGSHMSQDSKPLAGTILSHWISLTIHKFKDKGINNFKRVIKEY